MSDPSIFINRIQEIKYLVDDIGKDREVSRLILISAKTGIGKTELINKAFSEFINGQFRVKIPIDNAVELSEGHVFKEITKIVHKNAKNYKEYKTITSFIQTHNFYKGIALGVTKTVSKYLGVKYFEEGYQKGVDKAKVKEWISDDSELLQICFSYLLSILKKHRVLIAIENFQKIDEKSLGLIKELLISSKNVYLAAEFTIKKEHSESDSILNFLENERIELNKLTVEKIPKKELVNAVVNEKDLIITILQDTYDKSDGNLHKFKLLKQASKSTNFNVSLTNYDSVTTSIMNNIGVESTMLFAHIESHSGQLGKNVFKHFLKFQYSEDKEEYQKRKTILKDLENIGLIQVGPESIAVHHDSLSIDFKKINQFRKVYPIVARDWIRYYQFLEKQPISNEETFVDNLLWQIHFLLKIESFDEIGNVLQKLSRCVAEGPYNNIINYVDMIASAVTDSRKTGKNIINLNIMKWIVVLYYQCGFSKRIVEFVNPTAMEDPIILLCYLASCSTLEGKHEEIIRHVKSIRNHAPNKLKLGLILVEIRTLRSSYELEKAKQLWIKHYKKETFKETSYEAAFLKYASLVFHDEPEFRIECLTSSSKLYEESCDYYGMISTYNTLGRDLAYVNNLELAETYFSKAEEISSHTVYPKYQLYNNISTLEIVNRKINQRTTERLNNALKICTNEGDQLIISSNLLCIYILKKDEFYGYRLYNNLMERVLNSFNKKSLIGQICLYNCWRYATSIGNLEEANNLIENYLKQMNFYRHSELWNDLLENPEENIIHPVISREIYPHFIIDWEVDYYNALNNY